MKQIPKRPTWKEEQQWIKVHRSEYVGHWVALWGNRLLSHGTDAKEVYESARRQGIENPLFTRIELPEEFRFNELNFHKIL